MNCLSTRGAPPVSAAQALVSGLAPDGGLYVPEHFPEPGSINLWPRLGYAETTERVLELFFPDFSEAARKAAARALPERFDCPEIVPMVKAGGAFFMELYHGPTRAFKDVAMTVLPSLLQDAMKQVGSGKRLAIMTATSGDTGPAVMSGFADMKNCQALIFYPNQGISDIQRHQMLTLDRNNVSACAIEGNFDDAQAAVKRAFSDLQLQHDLAEDGVFLTSANSINLGRLVPQIAYHLNAYNRLVNMGAIKGGQSFDIVVPTGNFGNLLAAWWAKRLGLPIRRLVCASNENDAVARFLRTGVYDRRQAFQSTNSPSMDILVSSNLERLFYDITDGDVEQVAAWMNDLEVNGHYSVGPDILARIQSVFSSESISEKETEAAIATLWKDHGYLADPHTAVAWEAWRRTAEHNDVPAVIAATASPWKFPTTVCKSLGLPPSGNDFTALADLSLATNRWDEKLERLQFAPCQHRQCAQQAIPSMIRNAFLPVSMPMGIMCH